MSQLKECTEFQRTSLVCLCFKYLLCYVNYLTAL